MIAHFFEVWGILLLAFAVGGVLGTILYIVLAATPFASAQIEMADAVADQFDAIRDYFHRRREPVYRVRDAEPIYVAPPPPASFEPSTADGQWASQDDPPIYGPDGDDPEAAYGHEWDDDVVQWEEHDPWPAETPADEIEPHGASLHVDVNAERAEPFAADPGTADSGVYEEPPLRQTRDPLIDMPGESGGEAPVGEEMDLSAVAAAEGEGAAAAVAAEDTLGPETPPASLNEPTGGEPGPESFDAGIDAEDQSIVADTLASDDVSVEQPSEPVEQTGPLPDAPDIRVEAPESPAGVEQPVSHDDEAVAVPDGSPDSAVEDNGGASPERVETSVATDTDGGDTVSPDEGVAGADGSLTPDVVEREEVAAPAAADEELPALSLSVPADVEAPADAAEMQPEATSDQDALQDAMPETVDEPGVVAPEVVVMPPTMPIVPEAADAGESDADISRPLPLAGPRNGVPDNLQRIRGIGQKNEALLNSLGIYHFGQIAAWTPAEARWVASHLPFPERLERDDWIGQAMRIATGADPDYDKGTPRLQGEGTPVEAA